MRTRCSSATCSTALAWISGTSWRPERSSKTRLYPADCNVTVEHAALLASFPPLTTSTASWARCTNSETQLRV